MWGKIFDRAILGAAIPFFTNDSGVGMGKNFIGLGARGGTGGVLVSSSRHEIGT